MLPLIGRTRDLDLPLLHLDVYIRMKGSGQCPIRPSDLDHRSLNSGLYIYLDAGWNLNRHSSYA